MKATRSRREEGGQEARGEGREKFVHRKNDVLRVDLVKSWPDDENFANSRRRELETSLSKLAKDRWSSGPAVCLSFLPGGFRNWRWQRQKGLRGTPSSPTIV